MKVFGIRPNGEFNEFVETPFQAEHEEAVLESWLESNPDRIVEDEGILIIGRQVSTNLGGFIDLLGVDRDGNVVVVELKRDRTPRDTIAQSLEYASFAERLDSDQLEDILRSYLNDESLRLAEHHREHFELSPDEGVAFNKDQRLVVVGQNIAPAIKQTALFLCAKGIRTTCIEFAFFRADDGTRLLSQETVVGAEAERPIGIRSRPLQIVSEKEFLASLDENGRAVFSRILQLARDESMPIHWGTKGFSLNVNIDGTHTAVCYAYPPDSVYKQTLRTTFADRGGLEQKTAVPKEVAISLREQANATGLFVPAGRELKCQIMRKLADSEIDLLVEWCRSVAQAIRAHGLRE